MDETLHWFLFFKISVWGDPNYTPALSVEILFSWTFLIKMEPNFGDLNLLVSVSFFQPQPTQYQTDAWKKGKLWMFARKHLEINFNFGYLSWKKPLVWGFFSSPTRIEQYGVYHPFLQIHCYIAISIRSICVVMIILCLATLSFGVPKNHQVFSEGMKKIDRK